MAGSSTYGEDWKHSHRLPRCSSRPRGGWVCWVAELAENLNRVLTGPLRSAAWFSHADVMGLRRRTSGPFLAEFRRGKKPWTCCPPPVARG